MAGGKLHLTLIASALLAGAAASPAGARAGGWSFPLPPNLVTPDSGRRNHVFFVGETPAFTFDKPAVATRFEVRDYFGEVVDRGEPARDRVTLAAVKEPGWYKLYLHGPMGKEPWGDVVGGTTFVVFRRHEGFPDPAPKGTAGGSYPAEDEVMRGVAGIGPQRHAVIDAAKPDEAIGKLAGDIALDRKYYLPFDPERKRALMVAFPNGTKDLDGVRKVVGSLKGDVAYWEPRNEPNGGSSGADFAAKEMKPFYEAVKAVDPGLKVMGPGTVSIGPGLLPWIEDFFKAGGAKSIDVFSFHAYNNINGDLWLARKSMDTLAALLERHGVGGIEKWQTEQGFFAAVYGAYQPRLQGRWTMLEMMVFEQYGIPKEHNHLWYDRSHGFWDMPTWWENDDGGLNPAAPLMRVWSEELYGTRFARRYDLGEVGNKLAIGSLFEGKGRRVAAFQSAGSTDGRVELAVAGGKSLRLVSAFGRGRDLPVAAGRASLPVPELPVYVELAEGQSIEVIPADWGPNLARRAGATAAASGTGVHPVDRSIKNDIAKVINGELENWYWSQQKDDQPWMDDTKAFPAWVEVRLPEPAPVARVVVYAAPPWQWQGTLLDYELQVDRGGTWETVERVQEPPRVHKVFTPPTRTTVDQFASDRWIFQHHLPAPITTGKVRLLVHDTTFGGGATKAVADAGGQTGPHQIMLREVEIYGR